MNSAYIESSVWIARAEGLPEYRLLINKHIQQLRNSNWNFSISGAVLLEVLSKPRQKNRQDLIDSYNTFFLHLHHLKTFGDVFDKALRIAQSDQLKGMDAVHVAFAVEYECELFVTTDPHYRTLKSLPLHFIDLSQVAPT